MAKEPSPKADRLRELAQATREGKQLRAMFLRPDDPLPDPATDTAATYFKRIAKSRLAKKKAKKKGKTK